MFVIVFAFLYLPIQCASLVGPVESEVDVLRRQVEVPTANNFRRRALHSSG